MRAPDGSMHFLLQRSIVFFIPPTAKRQKYTPTGKAGVLPCCLVNLEWSYEEIAYPGLDFVIHATEPGDTWQMIAIGRKNSIAVVRYAGREWLPDHLPVLSEAVK